MRVVWYSSFSQPMTENLPRTQEFPGYTKAKLPENSHSFRKWLSRNHHAILNLVPTSIASIMLHTVYSIVYISHKAACCSSNSMIQESLSFFQRSYFCSNKIIWKHLGKCQQITGSREFLDFCYCHAPDQSSAHIQLNQLQIFQTNIKAPHRQHQKYWQKAMTIWN